MNASDGDPWDDISFRTTGMETDESKVKKNEGGFVTTSLLRCAVRALVSRIQRTYKSDTSSTLSDDGISVPRPLK